MWRRIYDRIAVAAYEETLRTAVGAFVTAVLSAGTGALISGAWAGVALALAALAVVAFLGILLSAAIQHRQELAEANYDLARREDAKERKSTGYERNQRAKIAAAQHDCDPQGQQSEMRTLLERCRKYITDGRIEPVQLLLINDAKPHQPEVVAEAGRFDHSLFSKPKELFHWLDALAFAGKAHSALVSGPGDDYRLVGLTDSSDSPLDEHDIAEIERAASHAHSLMLAQHVATIEQRMAG